VLAIFFEQQKSKGAIYILMDDKKKYYEEKAKELLNFNMMAKQSKMSDNLHKMARGEAIMLECLAHSDNGLMPNEIAKSAHVSTARVAAFLKAVEKKGYIQRISLEGDRRKVNIVLTDIGWDAVKGRRERMLKGVVAYLERLGEEDTENLLRILEKTRTIMKKNNDMKGKQ
jgi:DNA-binding MarR family transcriptional regulator